MKNIIRTLLAASLALTAIGCDQDQIATKFDPSAEAANTAYFVQNAISQEFDATATGDQTIEVAIYRQNAQGDFTVELTPTIPEDAAAFFDVPKTAEFKNGQYSVMIPVTVYNVENLAKGATYSVKIAVANGGSWRIRTSPSSRNTPKRPYRRPWPCSGSRSTSSPIRRSCSRPT